MRCARARGSARGCGGPPPAAAASPSRRLPPESETVPDCGCQTGDTLRTVPHMDNRGMSPLTARVAVGVVVSAQLMSGLDNTVVNLALPGIGTALGESPT